VVEDFTYHTLDRNEYNRHKAKMEYPAKLKQILEVELALLKQKIENREFPFDHDLVKEYFRKYKEDYDG
jgi:protein associated with RNAse G/E